MTVLKAKRPLLIRMMRFFYEIVMTARTATEAYLITGNKKHYPVKSFVETPREMLDIIGEE